VQFLLMGGQACILYGGAEFSRDIDLSISIHPNNLVAVQKALSQLKAEVIFFPDLDVDALRRGHACHFRCHAEGVEGLRIDLMTKMRGCPEFNDLWERRSIVELPDIGEVGLLSLSDLLRAKKTQREKDWPMIRRLIETDLAQNQEKASEEQITFWLMECRTPTLLVKLAQDHTDLCKQVASRRPLLKAALAQDINELEESLYAEEKREKEKDREYWQPLRMELEQWRSQRKL
jgi:hypothetical protein